MREFGRRHPIGSKQATALDVIRDAEFPLIATFWKRAAVLVKVRELSAVQLRACGEFSLIDLGELKGRPFSWEQWVEYAETQYKIIRAALVSPTYDQIFKLVGQGDMVRRSQERFRDIQTALNTMPRGPAKQEAERELARLRCQFDYLLPEDFLAPIISYEVGLDKSDIKAITKSMLLDAAVLADRGHDNPVDHMAGMFTDFNRDDINRRAWQVYEEWKAEQSRAKARR